MSKDAQLIVRPGIPVIKADKIRYFTDPYFKERYNAVPMHEVKIGDEKRRVPIPTKLPKGEWLSYRESLASSGYYKTQTAPAVADAGAGIPPPPLSLAKTDFPTPDKPAIAYTLPPLPATHIPYCRLHSLLSTPLPPAAPSTHAAVAYAESIVRYWQANLSANEIDDDEWLSIVDLSAGDGQFAWQLMNALFARLATIDLPLPPFRYIACVDDAQQLRALDAHPYFSAATDEGHFVVTTRDALINDKDGSYAANPCVAIANGTLRELPHELLAVRGGALFRIDSKVTGAPGPQERQLQLDHQWSPLQPDPPTAAGAAVAEVYRGTLGNGVVLLPGGGLNLVDQVSRLAGGNFLFLSVDKAVNDEREIGLGAFRLPTQVTVPLPALPTNYHALDLHLRAIGARVWQESILDSDLCFMVALRCEDQDDVAGSFADLLAPVASAHSGAERRAAELARRQLLTLPDCLSLLQRTNYDPRIIDELFPFLRAAEWKLSSVDRERWQQALARCWGQYLPVPKTVDFYAKLVTLARHAGHWGLARGALRTGMAYFGETVDDLCQIADCELITGNTLAAQTALDKALAILPQHETATRLMREVARRLEDEKSHAWFRGAPAAMRGVRLEPLSPHHAQQLHVQYRDPRISMSTMLPALASVEQTRTWIDTETALKENMNCAIMHEHWGLVGYASAQRSGDAAYFSFWIGTDHQRHGYGRIAAAAMFDMLRKSGLKDLFAANFQDNVAARRTLDALGFQGMEVTPKSPYHNLRFAHLGLDEEQGDTRGKLDALCTALAIPVEFDAPNAAPGKEEAKRSR
jgi:RimJ/RimL family protein N-acetyltransferase